MNNNFGITELSYRLLIETLSAFPEIEEAKIFGSRAMGNYKKGSDIDLVLFGNCIESSTLSKFNSRINERLPIPYFIDIIDYKSIENKKLKEHIAIFGKLIYKRNA